MSRLAPGGQVEDQLQVYRSLIQHEDALRNQRLGWMLTATAFLFAALSFAWDRAGSLPLVYIIAVVGLLVSVSTLVGLYTNDIAIADLRDRFGEQAGRPPTPVHNNPRPILRWSAWTTNDCGITDYFVTALSAGCSGSSIRGDSYLR